jgi:hypothetical protein
MDRMINSSTHFILPTLAALLFSMVTTAESALANQPAPETRRSEFFWHPRAEMSSISFNYSNETGDYSQLNTNTGITQQISHRLNTYAPDFQFGLSETWALELPILQYAETQNHHVADNGTTSDLNSRGFNDPQLTLHYSDSVGRWSFHAGHLFRIALGPVVQSTATQVGNNSLGGISLSPYLGASRSIGRSEFVGFKLQYTYLGDRVQANASGGDSFSVGGHQTVFSTYYELQWANFYLMPSASLRLTQSSNANASGKTTETAPYDTKTFTLATGVYFSAGTRLNVSFSSSENSQASSGATITDPTKNWTSSAGIRSEF